MTDLIGQSGASNGLTNENEVGLFRSMLMDEARKIIDPRYYTTDTSSISGDVVPRVQTYFKANRVNLIQDTSEIIVEQDIPIQHEVISPYYLVSMGRLQMDSLVQSLDESLSFIALRSRGTDQYNDLISTIGGRLDPFEINYNLQSIFGKQDRSDSTTQTLLMVTYNQLSGQFGRIDAFDSQFDKDLAHIVNILRQQAIDGTLPQYANSFDRIMDEFGPEIMEILYYLGSDKIISQNSSSPLIY